MDDISVKKALVLPAALSGLMIALAAGISWFTGVDGSRVFYPYFEAWFIISSISVLIWIFVEVARMMMERADNPMRRLARKVPARHKLFIIPALFFPLFLAAYTWAKSSIPFLVGYPFERFWADVDHALIGDDAWRLAHSTIDRSWAPAWSYFYVMVWGYALAFTGPLVAAFASRRFTATFFTAMMLSWLLGGVVLAYALSCAGPVFAHLSDPSLANRFAPLRSELIALLGPDDVVMTSQRYLGVTMSSKFALKGGGISAMPSMHIATATILVLAAWKTRWLLPAVMFWTLTFFGSVFLGYHYAVDAPVAAMVAFACWFIARQIYQNPAASRKMTKSASEVSLERLPVL